MSPDTDTLVAVDRFNKLHIWKGVAGQREWGLEQTIDLGDPSNFYGKRDSDIPVLVVPNRDLMFMIMRRDEHAFRKGVLYLTAWKTKPGHPEFRLSWTKEIGQPTGPRARLSNSSMSYSNHGSDITCYLLHTSMYGPLGSGNLRERVHLFNGDGGRRGWEEESGLDLAHMNEISYCVSISTDRRRLASFSLYEMVEKTASGLVTHTRSIYRLFRNDGWSLVGHELYANSNVSLHVNLSEIVHSATFAPDGRSIIWTAVPLYTEKPLLTGWQACCHVVC